jgi:hypothetical protein
VHAEVDAELRTSARVRQTSTASRDDGTFDFLVYWRLRST